MPSDPSKPAPPEFPGVPAKKPAMPPGAAHAVPEAADEPLPDATPASHAFSKEAMIIEPPTFQEMTDLGDVQTLRFWNLLWFNWGRPILVFSLWVAVGILVTHVVLKWDNLPHGVLVTAVSIAALLLAVSVWRRYLKPKPRKNTESVQGAEISAFFGTDKDAHRAVRHSKRVDAWFDGTRVALVSEKQETLVEGRLPFTTKGPDGRPLRILNPGAVSAARAAGFPGAKAEPAAGQP